MPLIPGVPVRPPLAVGVLRPLVRDQRLVRKVGRVAPLPSLAAASAAKAPLARATALAARAALVCVACLSGLLSGPRRQRLGPKSR